MSWVLFEMNNSNCKCTSHNKYLHHKALTGLFEYDSWAFYVFSLYPQVISKGVVTWVNYQSDKLFKTVDNKFIKKAIYIELLITCTLKNGEYITMRDNTDVNWIVEQRKRFLIFRQMVCDQILFKYGYLISLDWKYRHSEC